MLSAIELNAEVRHKSGSLSTILFSATLISDYIPECEEVSITKAFKRKDLDELKDVKGYKVVVE